MRHSNPMLIGTVNLFELSKQFGVRQFNFISTDKAINPCNVMGLTKKLAESYILNSESSTKVNVLRFGNIFGSSGSVVDNFEAAITKHKELKISHPNMRRFFILPQDIALFILSSPLNTNHRDTVVFHLSEQTTIESLAKNILLLKGYPAEFDFPITIGNDRKFQKLEEELYNTGDIVSNTDNAHIKRIPNRANDRNIIEQIHTFNAQLNKDSRQISFELLNQLFKKPQVLKT